jgi:HAMP domain-containing protein
MFSSTKARMFLLILGPIGITLAIFLFFAINTVYNDKLAFFHQDGMSRTDTLAREVANLMNYEMENSLSLALLAKKDIEKARGLVNTTSRLVLFAIFEDSGQGLQEKERLSNLPLMEKSRLDKSLLDAIDAKTILKNALPEKSLTITNFTAELHRPSLVIATVNQTAKEYYLSLILLDDLMSQLLEDQLFLNTIVDTKGAPYLIENSAPSPKNPIPVYINDALANEQARGQMEVDKNSHGKFFLSWTKLPALNLAIITAIPSEKLFSSVRLLAIKGGLLVAILLILATVSTLFLANSIVTPLRQLTRGLKEFLQGNFTYKIFPHKQDEYGLLFTAFNNVGDVLLESKKIPIKQTTEKGDAKLLVNPEGHANISDTPLLLVNNYFPLPKARINKLEIAGFNVLSPMSAREWWNYSDLDDQVIIWSGRVLGKDFQPSFLIAAIRSSIVMIERIRGISPAKAMGLLNDALYSVGQGKMVMSFTVASCRKNDNALTYAYAGHPAIQFFESEVDSPKLKTAVPMSAEHHPPLGQNSGEIFFEHTHALKSGDTFVCYNEGVTALTNIDEVVYGEHRFIESAEKILNEQSDLVVSAELIGKAAQTFAGTKASEEDVTLWIGRIR